MTTIETYPFSASCTPIVIIEFSSDTLQCNKAQCLFIAPILEALKETFLNRWRVH